MKEKLRYWTNKKSFHIAILIILVVVILFILGMTVLKYHVEGETNMPFVLTKIAIISSSEGNEQTIENPEHKWNFVLNQNNDIYIYLDKNSNYDKEEIIQSVKIDHFNVIKSPLVGTVKWFKPDASTQKGRFQNNQENEIQTLTYTGDTKADTQNLTIANQGGIFAFRVANCQVGEYHADDEEIIHDQLLTKTGITNEQLQMTVEFDLFITLHSGKEFKTTITLDLPRQNLIEKGTTSEEIDQMDSFIFKRVKN